MTHPAHRPAVSGQIGDAEFARVAELVHRMTGIHLTDAKRAMVTARLSKRVKALRLRSISEYCRLVEDENAEERTHFIEALTTNVTQFDREAHQFRHLEHHVLPELVTIARSGGRVRIWSAGCSSGEEAYSLAFRVLDACPEANRLDLRILATDIDRKVLDHARAGRYRAASLLPLSEVHRNAYFRICEEDTNFSVVRDEVRGLIAFRSLNLQADWPFSGPFDVIMCRNVAIYFDPRTQDRLWRRLTSYLNRNGVLYIGHSEGLSPGVVENFVHEGAGAFRLDAQKPTAPAQSMACAR